MEKAREIKVKADEEFAIEKVRVLDTRRDARGPKHSPFVRLLTGKARQARAAGNRRAV